MKVLHVVSGDMSGGAARGAYWLHLALLEQGVTSRIITDAIPDSTKKYKHVYSLKENKVFNFLFYFQKFIKVICKKFFPSKISLLFSFGIDGYDIRAHYLYKDSDLIHLHHINSVISLKILSKITKPLVWTLRDMWAFTGGCHYSLTCNKYLNHCTHCYQVSHLVPFNISSYILNRKQKLYPKSITYVAISSWLADCASKSSLLNKANVKVIMNNVDTNSFKHINSTDAKNELQIKDEKKIVLFGSLNVSDPYKGFKYFLESLVYLDPQLCSVAIFGNIDSSIDISALNKFSPHFFGSIKDLRLLNLIYSACDVFVAPSIQEAFGKTLVESMIAGTPVVCFDHSGPSDIVVHEITGYKAKLFDSYDLSNGINWLTSLSDYHYNQISLNCNSYATTTFSAEVSAQRYRSLYENIIYQ